MIYKYKQRKRQKDKWKLKKNWSAKGQRARYYSREDTSTEEQT